MVRLLALVEGPTERNFGQKVLAPHFGHLGIEFHPRVIGKPGHKGGVRRWEPAKREIVGLIRQETTSVFTTMFDYYGLPNDWPGKRQVSLPALPAPGAVQKIEEAIEDEIRDELRPTHIRFLAYIALHEFEALLFSNTQVLANVTGDPGHQLKFDQIVADCGGCEQINEGPTTAPSKRIKSICRGYNKVVDGVVAAERMGLNAIRENVATSTSG